MVRHGSATPSPPVQIRQTPLLISEIKFLRFFFIPLWVVSELVGYEMDVTKPVIYEYTGKFQAPPADGFNINTVKKKTIYNSNFDEWF